MTQLFKLGQIVATPDAIDRMTRLEISPFALLRRHQSGDWGNVDAHDRKANDWAVHNEARILSSYGQDQSRIWIITEADRSSTCILLPEDY